MVLKMYITILLGYSLSFKVRVNIYSPLVRINNSYYSFYPANVELNFKETLYSAFANSLLLKSAIGAGLGGLSSDRYVVEANGAKFPYALGKVSVRIKFPFLIKYKSLGWEFTPQVCFLGIKKVYGNIDFDLFYELWQIRNSLILAPYLEFSLYSENIQSPIFPSFGGGIMLKLSSFIETKGSGKRKKPIHENEHVLKPSGTGDKEYIEVYVNKIARDTYIPAKIEGVYSNGTRVVVYSYGGDTLYFKKIRGKGVLQKVVMYYFIPGKPREKSNNKNADSKLLKKAKKVSVYSRESIKILNRYYKKVKMILWESK